MKEDPAPKNTEKGTNNIGYDAAHYTWYIDYHVHPYAVFDDDNGITIFINTSNYCDRFEDYFLPSYTKPYHKLYDSSKTCLNYVGKQTRGELESRDYGKHITARDSASGNDIAQSLEF